MSFELPKLNYAFDALEPYIDAQTMEIHFTKHHGAYTSKLNAALEGSDAAKLKIEDILSNISQQSIGVRNNGGGYFNHILFWEIMSPNGGGEPSGDLATAINDAFGSFVHLFQLLHHASYYCQYLDFQTSLGNRC